MKHFNHVATIFTLLFFSITAQAAAVTKVDPNEQMVKEQYLAWCSSIGKAHGDAKIVTQYYAPDAVLMPTLSSNILYNNKGDLEKYFVKLTSKPDIKCTPKKLITKMMTKTAVNTGTYDFSYTKDGKTVVLPARFTFVYKNIDGKWLIIKHHSTKMMD